MKKVFWTAIAIAFLAAFFASTNPDGLDFVSEKLGFGNKGIERKAVMTGYSFPFLQKSGISTAAAGAAGVLITFAVFGATVLVLKKKQQ